MNTHRHTLALLTVALCAVATSASASLLSISQYPLFLTRKTLPNVLVVYDNSESMDGTMAGKLIEGDDPNTRGNIARGIITNEINKYAGLFNWGLETFQTSWPNVYTTYAYYMGDNGSDGGPVTMMYTNDCVNGISASNSGLRCIPNPEPANGYNSITYDRTGDDPDVNDVLYAWYWGPQAYAFGDYGSTNYNMYTNHSATGAAVPARADMSGYMGDWGFSPTDAGFLPSTPPYPSQIFIYRNWDYYADVTGMGSIVEPVMPSGNATHFSNLLAALAPETGNPWSPEIKNAAVFTPLAGSMLTASQYFTGADGYASPISLTCQRSFVLLATDGRPTAQIGGWDWMWPLSEQQTVQDPVSLTWTYSPAAQDVFPYIQNLRATTVGGFTHDIQTYVVGLGDTVANPPYIANLNQFASLGGTNQAYLAQNAGALASAFQAIAVDIESKTAAASAVSLNTGSWGTATDLYQARFSSGDWSGQLLKYPVNQDGSLGGQIWDAGQVINTLKWDTGRTILTYKPSAGLGSRGISFLWPGSYPGTPLASEMDIAQSSLLNADETGNTDGFGAQRLQWIRGNTANESGNCSNCTPSFRNRPTSVLGDIVHSAPFYVAAPASGYPDTIEAVPYSSFATANANRTPTIYVGANDGMLHAFSAATGAETLAYIPSSVYQNLSALSTQNLSAAPGSSVAHNYYVDGSPTVADVFYTGAWHTMLVGGLAAGGQGVYALDITNPNIFAPGAATSIVRWEFTDANDADLGYVFGQPLLVKTNNGRWSVIVANGYNNTQADANASSTGHAVLFVLDAETGAVTAKIDTNAGTPSNPDGLSGPIALDLNGDGTADVVYAGDLNGNLWKFDLSSTNAGSWQVALGGAPLFSNAGQPITVRPDVTKFSQGGYLVVFGTGRYIDTGDNLTTDMQTFYGIRDQGYPVSGLTTLVQQSVAGLATGADGNTYRISTHAVGPPTLDTPVNGDNTVATATYNASDNGWYLNLPTTGERVVTDPAIRSGRVVFNTLIPNTDPCGYGGSGWVMEVDVMTGNRYDSPTFDTDGNLQISAADLVDFAGASDNASGRSISSIPAAAGYLSMKPGYENKYINTSSGNVNIIGETAGIGAGNQGRLSWRQIQ